MEDNLDTNDTPQLLNSIIGLIDTTRQNVARTVNQELTLLYWNIGKNINDDVLKNDRADYGKKLILGLSQELSKRYGTGFNKRNLHSFIKLNTVFQDIKIVHTLCAQLSWSHIRTLIYIENQIKREFYLQMCKHERWSVRTLQERIDGMLFERTAISKRPEETIINELKVLENEKKISPDLAFRDPYFLDFFRFAR